MINEKQIYCMITTNYYEFFMNRPSIHSNITIRKVRGHIIQAVLTEPASISTLSKCLLII